MKNNVFSTNPDNKAIRNRLFSSNILEFSKERVHHSYMVRYNDALKNAIFPRKRGIIAQMTTQSPHKKATKNK